MQCVKKSNLSHSNCTTSRYLGSTLTSIYNTIRFTTRLEFDLASVFRQGGPEGTTTEAVKD